MGTLGSKARRLAKRQQYDATHPAAGATILSAADRPAIRAQEGGSPRLLKGNSPFQA